MIYLKNNIKRCTVTYFKPSGKFYTEDKDVQWLADPDDCEKWQRFEDVVRIKDMIAVCFDSPHGYPQMYVPKSFGKYNLFGEK